MLNCRMRISSLAALIAMVAAACNPLGTSSETPQRPPKIVFRESTHDFGHVEQGMPVRYVYAFRNAGGLDLTIENVRAPCGCRATLISAVGAGRVITARGEGAIEATCETALDLARTTRTITVYSNDPAQPVATLTLRADIDADVAADPPQLYVGHLARGQVAPNDVRVVATDPAAAAVGPVETRGRVIDAGLRDPAPGTTGKRIRIAIKQEAPPGRFRESVLVRTNSPRRPVLTIPVTGVVDGDAASSSRVPEKK